MAGFNPNQPRDERGRWTSTGSNAVALGVAATLVLSGLGSGTMGATSVSASAGESSTARIYRSEPNARTSRTDARSNGADDVFKITSRLKQRGYKVTFQAEPKKTNCEDYSDGDVPAFFGAHPCQSLHRQLIEIETKKNVIMLGMAMVQMSEPQTAMDLKTLLDQAGRGKIIQLSRDSGKHRHFSFTNSLATTTLYGTTVTAYDGQIISGPLSNGILIAFLDYALFDLGWPPD